MIKGLLRTLVILGLIGGIFAVGMGFFSSRDNTTQTGNAAAPQMEMPAMPVSVVHVERKPLRIWTSYPGRMAAVDYVELRPEVSGRIQEIRFEDGQVVSKGDVLFVIDPRPYEATVREARAALNSARDELTLAQKELQRAESLLKTDTVSKSLYDTRKNAAVLAKNAVDVAQAQLARAEINLDHAYIKAPISGRVSRAEITVGNVVDAGPNAPILTSIVSDEGIYADFEVDEQTYLRNIREHAGTPEAERKIPVRLTIHNDDSTAYEGFIKSFDNRIDRSSGTIRARAFFENKDHTLLPGMYVRISLGNPAEENVILLTDQAISTDQDRKYVYVVDAQNKVVYRPVTLGASVDGQHVIASGLEEGDQVIVDGLMKIRPDMVVAPRLAEEAAASLLPPDQPPETP